MRLCARQFLNSETQYIDPLSGILAIPPLTIEDMGISEPTEPYHFLRVGLKPGSWLTERQAGRRGGLREKLDGDVPNWKSRAARDTNHDGRDRWVWRNFSLDACHCRRCVGANAGPNT